MNTDLITIEQCVLGSLMILSDPRNKSASRAIAKLTDASFTNQGHRIVFQKIQQAYQRGNQFDVMSVSYELEKTNETVSFGYLAEIAKNTPSTASLFHYIEILNENRLARTALNALSDSIAMISDPTLGTPMADRVKEAYSAFGAVLMNQQKDQSKMRHIGDVLNNWLDRYESYHVGGQELGYLAPYDNINEILGVKGVLAGSLVVVGGLPKMGKTKVLTDWLTFSGKSYGGKTSICFSMEMESENLVERPLFGEGRLDNESVWRKDAFSDELTFGKICNSIAGLKDLPIFFDDSPAVTIDYIESEARFKHADNKVGLIAVDYLTLMNAPKAERNDLAFGQITKRLKNLAKELGCVVLLLTQLNRKVIERQDKRPYPQDSRDTGQIEQDCDLWIGVHKQSVFEDDNYPHKNIVELLVRVNRNGGTGTAFMQDMGAYLISGEKPHGFDEKPQEKPRQRGF